LGTTSTPHEIFVKNKLISSAVLASGIPRVIEGMIKKSNECCLTRNDAGWAVEILVNSSLPKQNKKYKISRKIVF